MVFPHRACGFAAGAAPIPVYGWDFFTEKVSPRHDWEVTKQSNGRVEPGRPCCARGMRENPDGFPSSRVRLRRRPCSHSGIRMGLFHGEGFSSPRLGGNETK